MMRKTLIATLSLVAVIAVVDVVSTDCATAADPAMNVIGPSMRVISSDATSRFMPLGLNKSVVIELPTDISEALVVNPKIVNAVVRSQRRVYIIGAEVGQTNVYFFDADGRQIVGLDITVSTEANLVGIDVTAYRGDIESKYVCTPSRCKEWIAERPPVVPVSNFLILNAVPAAPPSSGP